MSGLRNFAEILYPQAKEDSKRDQLAHLLYAGSREPLTAQAGFSILKKTHLRVSFVLYTVIVE